MSTLKEYIGEQTLASLIKLINSKFKKYVKTSELEERLSDLPAVNASKKKWYELGEYDIDSTGQISAFTFTDLPGYTEFVVYFHNTSSTVEGSAINFYINDTNIGYMNSKSNQYIKVHLELQDCWQFTRTAPATSSSDDNEVQSTNHRTGHPADPAVKLEIKNPYNASAFRKGTVTIYAAK